MFPLASPCLRNLARSLATTRVNFQVSMDCELKIGKPSYVELQQGAVFVTGGVSVTRWVRLNTARSQAIRTIKRCYSPSKVHRKETKTESRKPSLTPPSLPDPTKPPSLAVIACWMTWRVTCVGTVWDLQGRHYDVQMFGRPAM